MASDKRKQRDRRRKLFGVGARSLGRSVLHTVPGYNTAKSWQKTGQDWFDTLGNLKGAAMKLGQIAAQYRDFLPEQVVEQLARLQRDAEPWPFERLAPVLEAHWSEAQFAEVAHIEPVALAAASIGQVHRARLIDGTEVVVKIRYPGVADAVDADIANLARIFKFSRFIPARGKDIDAVMAELRERFIEETDYRQELANLQAMRAFDLPGYILPEPVERLCNEAVLVTTLLESEPIQTAPATVGQTVTEAICLQVFTHGLLHADPHPGNFGVTGTGAIALYDFGCVKQLDLDTRRAMRDIVGAALVEDWAGIHDGLERLGVVPPGQWPAHRNLYAGIYARHTRAVIEPLRVRPDYVFANDGYLDGIRREITISLKYWRHFKAAPELVFLMRTLSGQYWILRNMGAQATIYALLEDIAAGRFGPD